MRLLALVALFTLALAPAALADPVYNPANGHYYEVVFAPREFPFNGRISWSSADAAAKAMTYNGIQGHLATITSPQEDAFVRSLPGFDSAFRPFLVPRFGDVGPWLGGSLVGGYWEWVAHDDDGLFSDAAGNALPGAYEDWLPHEPNGGTGEPRLGYFRSRVGGLNNVVGWADYHEFRFNVPAYIVEYSVPEPGSVALLGAGVVLLIGLRKRRRQS